MFCLCIHCGSVNSPMWGQYTIIDCHGVTNTGSLWVLNLQTQMFQVIQLDYLHSQTTVICGIGKIIGRGGVTGR